MRRLRQEDLELLNLILVHDPELATIIEGRLNRLEQVLGKLARPLSVATLAQAPGPPPPKAEPLPLPQVPAMETQEGQRSPDGTKYYHQGRWVPIPESLQIQANPETKTQGWEVQIKNFLGSRPGARSKVGEMKAALQVPNPCKPFQVALRHLVEQREIRTNSKRGIGSEYWVQP